MTASGAHHLRMIFISLAWGSSLGAFPAAFAQESDLGRLFFTPEQRSIIVRARTQDVKEVTNTPPENLSPQPSMISLNGLVIRSHGPPTLWINGRLVEPGQDPVTNLLRVEGRTVQVAPQTHLKVGQAMSHDAASSTVIDLIEPGSVIQGRMPAKRKDDPPPGLRLKPSTSKDVAP